MKKVLSIIALVAFTGLVIVAGRQFNKPADAAMNHASVKSYLNQGFTVDSVSEQPYYYIVAPTGDYIYGTVEVKMHARTGGEFSLETTYATVTATVEAKKKGNRYVYAVSGADTQEVTVY